MLGVITMVVEFLGQYRVMVLWFLLLINLLSFVVMGMDKRFAQKGRRRIAEATLLFFAACFGAAGIWAGMQVFRHKTLKAKFTVLVPLLLILQLAIMIVTGVLANKLI